jgi:CHAT domain-containing protein
MIAVPDFQGRHDPLPAVVQETEILQSLLGRRIQLLTGSQASPANLFQLSANGQIAQFAFIHIATHAFSDQLTGRLSGLALYDNDLWLDELTQLAPMPPLVTLSACSGLRSLLYEGDEHVGIAVTCLVAGAQTVVGSLWPVLDDTAPDLMVDFYTHFLANHSSALALALAQRTARAAGVDIRHWGGFQCVGRP